MRLRPLPDDSLGALWLPVRLLWSSLRLRVGKGSSLSAWSFPFRGLSPFSRLFLSWRPCRSRSLFPSLTPSWWWPCPLLRWALLTLSGYVLSVPSAVFFASVSLIDPVALSPLLHRVFADGFWHWCAFRLCGGASPHAFGSIGALGVLRWLHLYRLNWTWLVSAGLPCGFGAQVGVSYFPVRHSARLHGDHFVSFPDSCVSLPHIYHRGQFLGRLTRRVTGWTLCPPRSSRFLSFAWPYSPDSLILMHPAIDIVWRCPCLPRLRLL